jgi:hypothetical protein
MAALSRFTLDRPGVDNSRKVIMVQESLTLPDGTPIPVVITVEGNKLFREEGEL